MPFIQFRRHNNYVSQQHERHLSSQNMKMQQEMYGQNNQFTNEIRMVPSHVSRVENKPRVSKSMDQCMLRPKSFSGYGIENQVLEGYQYQGNIITPSQQIIQPHIQQFFPPQQPINKKSRPGSNYMSPNTNLVLSPSKTLQKQV